ncbi:MAG: type II/IV secretion system protein [Treponema sp.]|nr:type II/IV secretion system protein [Treponema sp.]
MDTFEFTVASYRTYRECPDQYKDAYIRSACAVKISETDDEVRVAVACSRMEDTGNYLISFHAPKKVVLVAVGDGDFAEFIGNIVDADAALGGEAQGNATGAFELESISESAPVVNIINALCLEAVRRGASDIHIQGEESSMRIRFRIDGVLQTVRTMDKSLFAGIASRIKIMASLNIMEQRQPQDGRMQVSAEGVSLDFRVSFVPTAYGESIVLRIFNAQKHALSLDELGFSSDRHALLKKALSIPNGLILATGPTGSGKTTTLHALLRGMDREALKIITIEDPVERVLEHVDQIQVNESIGLTFDSMLRRVLRQDPDVIMVGEIRDSATAELAVRAALTGHVILSTLHTNDSVSAVTRLKNMGIEPYLVSSVLKYALAQRLVRKVCPHCAKTVPLTAEMKALQKKFGVAGTKMKAAVGCEQCSFTGYAGRTVVSEVFEIGEDVALLIDKEKSDAELRSRAAKNGMKMLAEDAVRKILAGVTTLEEAKREALV